MIFLQLFWEFLKIGMFAFGGAYGAIPLIQESIIARGWMDETMFSNILAISESTPGPIMVNSATYIGYTQGGVFGAAIATLGVVLPSFAVILLVSVLLKKWIKSRMIQYILSGIKPCLMGIILATGMYMFYQAMTAGQDFDYAAVIILIVLAAIIYGFKNIRKKEISPIILIIVSAVMGIIIY